MADRFTSADLDDPYLYNHGTPMERWMVRVDASGDCWQWVGRYVPAGYGMLGNEFAHRLAWVLFVGPIPDDMVVDHMCRNRGCVNPDHLQVVTQATNLAQSPATTAGRHRCRNGHPFTSENTYVINCGDGSVRRKCRTCQLRSMAKQRARKKVAA